MTGSSEEMVIRPRKRLRLGPRPGKVPSRSLAVVTCMDTRVDPLRVFGARPGEIHTIENAGGIVTSDVLRSLFISQTFLGTRRVAIVMHTDCGLLGLDDGVAQAAVATPLPFTLGGFPSIETRLRESVEQVRTAPFLPHRNNVLGYVYDVETGRLAEMPVS